VSLIDDALKRAREQGRADPAREPESGAPAEAPATETAAPTSGRLPAPAAADPWSYAPMPERKGRSAQTIAIVVGLVALGGIVGILALRRDRGPESSNALASTTPTRNPEAMARVATSTPLPTVFVPPPPRGIRGGPDTATDAVGAPRSAATVPPARPTAPPPAAAAAPVAPVASPRPSAPPAVAALPPPTPSRIVASAPFPPAAAPVADSHVASANASGSPRIAPASAAAAAPPPSRTSIGGAPAAPPRSDAAPAGRSEGASSAPRSDSASPAGPPATYAHPSGPAKTVTGSYTTPSGGKVELGGIVFSDSPVALINGRVVPVGGIVDGLTVASIEEGRIELVGDGVHVYLNLR